MADCDVAGSVRSIVSAFTTGRDIIKKIREKRRKKRASKHKPAPGSMEYEELRLSTALRRGSRDVQRQYEKSYGVFGKPFAKGDAIAHASLAQTLIKLNTGLVGIISSFLGRSKEDFSYDCKSLTTLSNVSRGETLEALDQLYARLSESAVGLRSRGSHRKSRLRRHSTATSHTDRKSIRSQGSNDSKKTQRRGATSQRTLLGPSITRLSIPGSDRRQLVIVRPRNRQSPSSSIALSSVHSTTLTPSSLSPATPPAPLQTQTQQARLKMPRKGDDPVVRPRIWPVHSPSQEKTAAIPQFPICLEQVSGLVEGSLAKNPPQARRRLVDTPSTYSFASVSTKLGEIPMHKWITPVDLEELERLNRITEKMEGMVVRHPPEWRDEQRVKKKGFWTRLKGKA